MKTVSVTFRLDEDIKEQAETLFGEMGMSLSTAFSLFLRQSLEGKAIPLATYVEEPNAVTLAAMEAAERDEELYGPYDSVHDLMEALNA